MDGVLLLGGPTASGKTEAAIALARHFDAEIVGADSRQVYRGMPIGTAAPSAAQQEAVPHHLVAFLDPCERYSAARFVEDALAAIDEIHERGRRAIVAGGTGFYLRALFGGVALGGERDSAVRERLAREAALHPAAVLHDWLGALDAPRAAVIHPQDRYRVLRALEVRMTQTQGPMASPPTLRSRRLACAYGVLDVPPADLDCRIEARVDAMLGAGFVEEAERVGPRAAASSAVGYPLALAWAQGWSTRDELRASLVRETRRYARRQRAWFRSERSARAVAPRELEAFARETLGWR